MRYLQALLLLLGAPALWMLVLGFGLAILGELTVFRRDPNEHGTSAWGSAFGVLLFLAVGSIAGLVAGFIQAITHIARDEGLTWKLATWLGIAAGITVCLVLQFLAWTSEYGGIFKETFVDFTGGAVVAILAMGTLGGYLGTLVSVSPLMSIGRFRGSKRTRHKK